MTGESFEVRVESGFRASHRRGPAGEEVAPHEHDWTVAVHARSGDLDPIALVVDFRVLRADTDAALDELGDRKLEDHPELDDTTPLAVGSWLLERLVAEAEGERWEIFAVEVEADPGVRFVVEREGSERGVG